MAKTMTLNVATRDGTCPTFLYTPDERGGPWPCVILYIDGPGVRPAIEEVAQRIADHGYAVAMPDLLYRGGPYAPIDPKVVWADPELRNQHRTRFMETATNEAVMSDTEALLAVLAQQPLVAPGPVAIVGYCMGGRLAVVAAGTFGDKVAVTASFHPGGLVTDKPDSPHLLAPKIKAKVYVAGAIEDAHLTDAHKAELERALTDAGLNHEVETYPARHGWVPRDMPAHDPAEAEHHWRVLLPLLDGALKQRT